jgi:hypothetical protein
VSPNSCFLTDYTQLWVIWKRVVLSRNLPRDGCLALSAASGNGISKLHWFRVCLAWCGIGWLNNVEHIEIHALETISQNLRLLNNGASSRHENQPWLLHSKRGNKQTVDFPLSVVNCQLKPLRLLLVHIIIYVSVIHIHLGTSLAVTIWIDEKNDLILLKLSSIWMKILDDCSCNLNFIQLNWIHIYLNCNQIKFL